VTEVNTTLDSFVKFCTENPELRFWQALRAWSGADKIIYYRGYGTFTESGYEDTFYWEGKNE